MLAGLDNFKSDDGSNSGRYLYYNDIFINLELCVIQDVEITHASSPFYQMII